LFLFIFIISFIYFSIWYKNFYFSFEADKGEIRKKVIGQSVSYLYYNRIQNVNVRQGILDRIFGIYSLNIETAGETSGSKFNLSGLSQEGAEKIREFLLERTKIYKNTL
jgi:putative membrane protein